MGRLSPPVGAIDQPPPSNTIQPNHHSIPAIMPYQQHTYMGSQHHQSHSSHSHYPPQSPNSPPPLEYSDSEDSHMDEHEQRQRSMNRRNHPPPMHPPTRTEHFGIPERYQTVQQQAVSLASSHFASSSSHPLPSTTSSSISTTSNFLGPVGKDNDGDSDMKECKSEEKFNPRARVAPLRPFFVHQWLDVMDTQDTWLECQVIALDPMPNTATSTAVAALTETTMVPTASNQPSTLSSQPQQQQQPQSHPTQKIKIHYKGFKAKYDEWLDVSSDSTPDMVRRIAPLHSHTLRANEVVHPRPFQRIGDVVDCKDSIGQWLVASILEIDSTHQQVKIRYQNWSDKFDEWLNMDSYRIQPHGRFTQAPIQPIQKRLANGRIAMNHHQPYSTLSGSSSSLPSLSPPTHPPSSRHSAAVSLDRIAQFQASHDNELRFRRILRDAHDWEIVDQKEDGNCLFRSVSHQVYGNPSFHHIVRQSAMDYIESEKTFFQHFIAGETFQEYIQRMRRDGEWGDNVEIQAMSEIYDRPIEIYAYSHKPLKTFTSGSSFNSSTPAPLRPPPIRLSYHFASHYNSIIDRSRHVEYCTTLQPGRLEQAALEKVATLRQTFEDQQRQRRQHTTAAASSSSPDTPEIPSLHASRQTFVSDQSRLRENPLDFENAVQASLADMDAHEAASIAAAEQQSLREHEEAQMLAASLKASQEEVERSAIEAAAAASIAEAAAAVSSSSSSSSSGISSSIEDATLRQALAASLASQSNAADDEDDLQRALRESVAAAGTSHIPMNESDADRDLRLALQSSLQDLPTSSSSSSIHSLPPAVHSCIGFGFPLESCVAAWEMIGEPIALTGATQDIVVERMMEYLCGQ